MKLSMTLMFNQTTTAEQGVLYQAQVWSNTL